MATLMRRFDSICSTDGDKTAFYTTALLLDKSVNTTEEKARSPCTVGFSELNENIKLIASELYHRHGLRPRQKSNLPHSDSIEEKCKLNILIASNQPSPGEAAAVMACTKLHIPFVPIALDGPHRTSDARVELILDEVKPTLAIVVLCLAEEKKIEIYDDDDWETRPAFSNLEIDVDSHPSILRLNRLGIHRIVVVKGQDGTVIGAMAGLQAEISIPSTPIEEDGDDAMYILYTSGSTSKPKAVVQSYLGLWNRIQWQWDVFPFVQQMRRKYGMKETLKLLSQDGIVQENESENFEIDDIVFRRTSLSFVDSIVEIFGPLLAGVSLWCPLQLHYHDQDTTPSRGFGLHYLLDMAMNDGIRITRMTCLPSQLGQALRIQKECDTKQWTGVMDFVIVSGEPCPSSLPALFEQCMSKKKSMLVNLYGQTESSGDVSCMVVSCDSQENEMVRFPNAIQYVWKRASKQECSANKLNEKRPSQNIQQSIVPCGYPIRGHKFMIKPFEKTDNIMTSLECGRLFVSGPGLALGYFNNENEMANNFVLQEDKGKKEIWLNTMDIAFLDNENDSVVVIGRAPKAMEHVGSQSGAPILCSPSIGKINGVMIHTSEMESAFNAALKEILVREEIASENHISESIGVLFSDKSNLGSTKSAIFCELDTFPKMIPPEPITNSQRVIDASLAQIQNSGLTFQDIVVDTRSLILSTSHPVLCPNYCFLVEKFPKNGAAGKVDRSLLVKFASDFVVKKSLNLPEINKDDEHGKFSFLTPPASIHNSNVHFFDSPVLISSELLEISLSDIMNTYSQILGVEVHNIKGSSSKIFSELGGDSMMAINATHQILATARGKGFKLLEEQVITPIDLMHSSIQMIYDILMSGRQSVSPLVKRQRIEGPIDSTSQPELPKAIVYTPGTDVSCSFLSKVWKVPLLMCIDSAPVILERNNKVLFVVASQGGDIAIIEAENGEVLHQTQVQGKVEGDLNYLYTTMNDAKSMIVFIPSYESKQRKGKGFLNAFKIHIEDSELSFKNMWRHETDGELKSKPCVCEQSFPYSCTEESENPDQCIRTCCKRVLIASYGGNLSYLDAQTGQLLDECNDLGGAIHADPIVINDWGTSNVSMKVLVATSTWRGKISCLRCNYDSLHKLWTIDLWTPIYAPPKHINHIDIDRPHVSSVIIFGVDGSVRSLDHNDNGKELWQVEPIHRDNSSRPIFTPCCMIGNNIMFGSYDGRIRCVDTRDGTIKWKTMELGSPIVGGPVYVPSAIENDTDGERLIVITTSGNIRVLNASNGSLVEPDNPHVEPSGCLQLDGEVFSNPLLFRRCLYVGCRDNHLYKLSLHL